MTEKILALGKRFDELSVQTDELRGKIAPLAQAEMDAEAAAPKEAADKAALQAEAAARADAAAKAAAEQAEATKKKAEEDAARAKAAEDAAAAVKAAEDAEAKSRAEAAAAKVAAEASSERQRVTAQATVAADTQTTASTTEKAAEEQKLREQAKEAARVLAEAAAAALQKPSEASSPAPAPTAAPAPPTRHPGVIKIQGGGDEMRQIMQENGSRKLVVVDFSAAWCGPCRAIAPFLEQLAVEYADNCVFLAVDCEATPANRSLAAEAGIRAFPTFHFYRDSQRVAETRGANREGIRAEIQKHAPSGGSQAKEAMTTRLFAALQTVKANTSFDEFCAAARTLLTFVSNVIAHPSDPKYKRVRGSNARFHNALGCRTGGIACMEAVGFAVINEGGEQVLVMQNMEAELPQVKRMLEEAMVAAEASRPAPAAAAPTPTPAAPPPFGGFGAGAGTGGMGGFGVMEGLGGMNNPMMQQMMQNPAMMEMAQRAMQNPAMMQMAQQMMAGGQAPDMASIRQMMAEPGMAQMAQEMMGSMGGMGGGGMPPGGMFGGMPPAVDPSGAPPGGAAPWPAPAPPTAPPTNNAPPLTSAPPAPAAEQGNAPAADTGEGAGLSEEEMIQEAIRRSMEDAS
eukprot:CAMPEP_0177755410 /NCGR_PEP_ID=MMETSP0491_2-20121128/2552_1 /TAXON_ID=63592 /ORGANISM="Tetraselmis chuii, Strain PLY429" /LENGTH=626 /DNA_ID=CAMNT_0019270907 /DNA_START=377 /DNA_END=2257 /DNA_ORIENTATION=-